VKGGRDTKTVASRKSKRSGAGTMLARVVGTRDGEIGAVKGVGGGPMTTADGWGVLGGLGSLGGFRKERLG
jgi:hypothetical protein